MELYALLVNDFIAIKQLQSNSYLYSPLGLLIETIIKCIEFSDIKCFSFLSVNNIITLFSLTFSITVNFMFCQLWPGRLKCSPVAYCIVGWDFACKKTLVILQEDAVKSVK